MARGAGPQRSRQLGGAALLVALALLGGAADRAAAIGAADAVAALNAQRAANGLPAGLVEAPAMTLGCANHLRYQQLNGGGLVHGEVAGQPGWTPEGAGEAPGSSGSEVLGFGDTWSGAWRNPWDDAPIHLALMMDPAAGSAGYAHDGQTTCMRIGASSAGGASAVYSVPGPGARDVPPSWTTNELPYTPAEVLGLRQPTGYNIIVWNRVTGEDDVASARLTGPAGEEEVRWADSRTPTPAVTDGGNSWTASRWEWSTMLLPVRPLRPASAYTLQVAFADGTPYRLEFRTAGAARPQPPVRLRLLSAKVRGRTLTAKLATAAPRSLRCAMTPAGARRVAYRRCWTTTVYRNLAPGRWTLRVTDASGRRIARGVRIR